VEKDGKKERNDKGRGEEMQEVERLAVKEEQMM